jgi:hypothetical protein
MKNWLTVQLYTSSVGLTQMFESVTNRPMSASDLHSAVGNMSTLPCWRALFGAVKSGNVEFWQRFKLACCIIESKKNNKAIFCWWSYQSFPIPTEWHVCRRIGPSRRLPVANKQVKHSWKRWRASPVSRWRYRWPNSNLQIVDESYRNWPKKW